MFDSILTRHKPDILDCIANLSNDEVFTPPALANKMLDLLPPEVWANPELRFLDPCCKSGVFLREAAKRLLKGLEASIPDEVARREHIFKNMLHGIAITELTAQITRRTLYYSKDASSEKSVVRMPTPEGNIRYRNIAHTFKSGSCVHCGAPESSARDLTHESHAYLFIHEKLDPTMKFDVIIGNPPYQLKDGEGGNGSSATPLYHKFVQKAIFSNPRYMSMIIPSRWFSGGKGLDEFRGVMLVDRRIKVLVDYADASECFPGVDIKGGVCYFLWDQQHGKDVTDACTVRNITRDLIDEATRLLDSYDVFVRFNKAVSILEKVREKLEPTFETQVSSRKPFGLDANFSAYKNDWFAGAVKVYARGAVGFMSPANVKTNNHLISPLKVLLSKAYGAGEGFPHQISGVPFVAESNSCCTETYLICGNPANLEEANCLVDYMKTKFFRFLLSLKKLTQNISKEKFSFIPVLSLSETWTDAKLYARYGLTTEEIAYIESMIKEMP